MLDLWRRQGVDELLHRALAGGAVLTGGSALEVYARNGEIVEEDIPCRRLVDEVVSRSVSS